MRIFGKKYRLPFQIRKRKPSAMAQIATIMESTPVQTVFDLGAYTGKVAGEFLALYPGCKVHAFEPTPKSYRELESRYANSDKVETLNCAVSDREGKAQFHIHTGSQTNSLLPAAKDANLLFGGDVASERNVLEVEQTTIDEYASRKSIDSIQILKMDIQGGELKALQGAERMLSEHAIDLIFCEVEFYPLYEKQPLYHDIASFLHRFGYHLYNFDNLNIKKPIQQLLWCDAIFVSQRILKAQIDSIK